MRIRNTQYATPPKPGQYAIRIRNTQYKTSLKPPKYAIRIRNTQYATLKCVIRNTDTQCAIRNPPQTRKIRNTHTQCAIRNPPQMHYTQYATHNTQIWSRTHSPSLERNTQYAYAIRITLSLSQAEYTTHICTTHTQCTVHTLGHVGLSRRYANTQYANWVTDRRQDRRYVIHNTQTGSRHFRSIPNVPFNTQISIHCVNCIYTLSPANAALSSHVNLFHQASQTTRPIVPGEGRQLTNATRSPGGVQTSQSDARLLSRGGDAAPVRKGVRERLGRRLAPSSTAGIRPRSEVVGLPPPPPSPELHVFEQLCSPKLRLRSTLACDVTHSSCSLAAEAGKGEAGSNRSP